MSGLRELVPLSYLPITKAKFDVKSPNGYDMFLSHLVMFDCGLVLFKFYAIRQTVSRAPERLSNTPVYGLYGIVSSGL